MGSLNKYQNNINLDDTNYEEDDPDTIILIRLLAWHIKFEKPKDFKKKISEELMPVAWHPKRWLDWRASIDQKKEIDPMFIKELQRFALIVYNMKLLRHFIEECVGST